MALEESLEDQVVFQQAAPAAPLEPAERARVQQVIRRGFGVGWFHRVVDPVAQPARYTIISLILLIASDGFRPFGHTSVQFMMVRQRNSRYGSCRLSSRSDVARSRLSARKR